MSMKQMFEDSEPIFQDQTKYVILKSCLLIIICMGTYTSIALASNLFIVLIGCVLFILLLYLMHRFQLQLIKFEALKKADIKYTLSILGIALIMYWTVSAIIGQPQNQMEVYKDLNILPLYISIIIFVILGPIFEELIFRGFMLKGMFKGHLLIGYIVSSVLFGLSHGPSSIGEFIIYFGIGLLFGALYLKTNRLEVAIIAHGLNNLVHILIYLVFFN